MFGTSYNTSHILQLFLEDVYEATGYRLAPDSPAALRPGGGRRRMGGGSVAQRDQRLVQVGQNPKPLTVIADAQAGCHGV
jgi:hypothetical protein